MVLRVVAVDLENTAISTAWLALLGPAAGHALFLQKTLPEN